MPTFGEVVPLYLRAVGITHVFGIPGVHNVELYRGLPQSSLRHVTPRHEQGAGFIADGFARASGRPAACFTITGPGLTNILTAMGQAYGDSVPMLVISSVNPRAGLGTSRGLLHELRSQRDMAAGVSALSQTILDPGQLPEILARAMAIFRSGRPRPVYIEIPTDVLGLPASEWAFRLSPPIAPAADPAAVDKALAALTAAARPVCILGGGAAHVAAEARTLVERFGLPTILTVNARGILSPDHPLLAGANLAAPAIRGLLAEADVVLAVGTEFGETEMAPLPIPVAIHGRLIRIDIDPEQLVRPILAEVPILADARLALAAMLDGAPDPRASDDGFRRAAETRKRLDDTMPANYNVFRALFSEIAAALPGFRLVGDSTKAVYAATEFLHMHQPRRFFSASTGFGTLGYALPAAIGACLAEPDVPTVAVVGDGGLLFTLPELAVAVAHRLPIVIVVWNNNGYAEIRDAMVGQGMEPVAVDHAAPDILAVAKAFGCDSVNARRMADVANLLKARRPDAPLLMLIDEAGFQ